jgi:hypothetical protein
MNRQELVTSVFAISSILCAVLGVATFFAGRRFRDRRSRLLWRVLTWSSLSSAAVFLGIFWLPAIQKSEESRRLENIKRSVMELERREREAAVTKRLSMAWFLPEASSAMSHRFSRPIYFVEVCDVQIPKNDWPLIRPSWPGERKKGNGAYGWTTRFFSAQPEGVLEEGVSDLTRDLSQAKTVIFYSVKTEPAAYGQYSKQDASIQVYMQAVDVEDVSRVRRIHGSSSPWSSVTFRGGASAGEGGASQIDGIQQPERLGPVSLFKACVASLVTD